MNSDGRSSNSTKTFLWVFFGCWLVCVSATANAATPKVTTVAGGSLGSGKAATSASFTGPLFVARDGKGNLYVSDYGHCRIRRIDTKGKIANVAGTGICGYSGDGGAAKSAMISPPYGLAFDSGGSLLFADSGNQRIRKITTAGTISTIAGNGTHGYSGDGGPATQAQLFDPAGISVDPSSGNIYIADLFNAVIRMVDTGGTIHTVAGNHRLGFGGDGGPATSAQLDLAYGVLADGNGNFYISDGGNYRVRKVDSTGTITTYAGNGLGPNGGNGGPATEATFEGTPLGLFLGGGMLYIAAGNNVWAVDLTTQIINIVAGYVSGKGGFNGDGQAALSTLFLGVWGLGSDASGNLVVVDSSNNRVRRIDGSQTVTTIAGGYIGDGGKGTAASLSYPGSWGGHIAFDATGSLYIADSYGQRIRKVSPTGIISTFAGTGISGDSGDGGPASAATLDFPDGLAADVLGNVYIAEEDGIIRKVDSSGTITTFSNTNASGLAVDSGGNVFAADFYSGVIWKITPAGVASVVAGVPGEYGYNGDGIPATQAWLASPTGVAIDKAGNLYIADQSNLRIRMVNTSGIISTVAGNGLFGFSGDGGPATDATLGAPEDVGVDSKGNLYIADTLNFRIRVVNSGGTINTLAGTGIGVYNGNHLPATQTNMFPFAVTVSPKGIVYVTDRASQLVRKIH